jgi:predicted RNase H-related nuclease YkuK (DUF458 family)
MEKYFNTITGEKVNIALHTLEILKQNPRCEIYVGTDSQDWGYKTMYATAIVYKHPNHKGAHFIYGVRNIEPPIKDIFARLFKECEDSLEVAEYLTKETGCRIKAIELDYADEKITKSTPLVKATMGWVTGAGYNVTGKKSEQLATRAADKIVGKKKGKKARNRHKKKRRG